MIAVTISLQHVPPSGLQKVRGLREETKPNRRFLLMPKGSPPFFLSEQHLSATDFHKEPTAFMRWWKLASVGCSSQRRDPNPSELAHPAASRHPSPGCMILGGVSRAGGGVGQMWVGLGWGMGEKQLGFELSHLR